VNGSGKHSSLLHYSNNYGHKCFIMQAQWSLRKKLFCCKYYSRIVTYSV
jgi:hypothetical protein